MEKTKSDWYIDKYSLVLVERNRYRALTALFAALLIISLLGYIFLIPLKKSIPYLVEVDKSSGITTVLEPTNLKTLRANPAITDYFITKYINARFSYNWAFRYVNANTVRAMSSAQEYNDYLNQMNINNPKSPVKLYANNKYINVGITNYTKPYPNMAEVHFYTQVSDSSTVGDFNNSNKKEYWTALIKFTYSNVPIPLWDREMINPIGFFVTNLQLNKDNA